MKASLHCLVWLCARGGPSTAQTVPILIGFSAVTGQTILMRELMVVFNGNEISLGIMLATWLLWTAAGSILGGWFVPAGSTVRRAVAMLECFLGLSLPPTIYAMRVSKSLFETVPGQLVGPAPMLFASLACLSVFCAISGALFVAAARIYSQECAVTSRAATSAAYLLEAAGSGLGGIATSLVLVRFLYPFQIAAVVLVLNLFMAAVLWFRMARKQLWAAAAAASLLAIFLIVGVAPSLDQFARERQWRGFHLAASRDTIYGNLAVTETGNVRSLYENGVLLATTPDESAAEEAVHYALLEHPAPRRILLIGGAATGGIAQALKHPSIERIDAVELDPALIAMARQYFPAESAAAFSDPRANIHTMDGRRYLASTRAAFDVIALNAPDPQTAQLNRFYTAEFFLQARKHLAPGGLFSLQLHSSEEAISPELAEFLRCIQRTLREVFPYVTEIPGDTIHFFAATQADALTCDPRTLVARLTERKLQTRYVREYFIPFRMTPDRMEQVRGQLEPHATTAVNRDFSPVAYYFNVVLWNMQFKPDYSGWLRAAGQINFGLVLAAAFFVPVLVALPFFMRGRRSQARASAASCIAATGFTSMALEITVLLAFQSIYGFVYHQLALLIGLCMAGIALGSWLGMRRIRLEGRSACRAVASTQVLLGLSAPVLMLLAGLLSKVSGTGAAWLAAQCVFPALAALSGMLCGYQFPLATELYLGEGCHSKLGMLYAIDLLGGCAGALVLSGYLIPIFGFWRTAWLCSAGNLAPILLALSLCESERKPYPR
jgi:spermidine synthase